MREALKLRGQHHVHEDGGQQHSQKHVEGSFLEQLHLTGEQVRVAGRQAHGLDGAHRIGCGRIERITGSDVGIDRDLKLAVIAPQRRGARPVLDRGHVLQAHLADFRRRHHQAPQHVRIVALFGEQLHRYGVLLGAFFEGGDLVPARIHQAHRGADIGHAHAQVGGALPVHLHLQLGAIQIEVGIDVYQPGKLPHSGGNLF